MLQEDALRAESKEGAFVRVFGLEPCLVFNGRLVVTVLELDIFGIETVLESDEGEQMKVKPFQGAKCSCEHDVHANFVLGEIPMVQFFVNAVSVIGFDGVVGIAVENFSSDKAKPDSACVQSK